VEKLRKPAPDTPPNRPAAPRPVAEAPAPPTLKPPKTARKAAPAPSKAEPVQHWLKSRPVQVNAGQIEISVSYHIAIAIGLGLILLLLVAFKVGQMDQRSHYATASTADRSPGSAGETTTSAPEPEPSPPAVTASAQPNPERAAAPVHGDHWIVLTSYSHQADLEAAKIYFANHDIATAIFAVDEVRRVFLENGLNADVLPSGDAFMLVTDPQEGLFDNPQKEGTDGYAMRQRIREVGADYDPPNGLKSFDFSEVYGMKVTK